MTPSVVEAFVSDLLGREPLQTVLGFGARTQMDEQVAIMRPAEAVLAPAAGFDARFSSREPSDALQPPVVPCVVEAFSGELFADFAVTPPICVRRRWASSRVVDGDDRANRRITRTIFEPASADRAGLDTLHLIREELISKRLDGKLALRRW